MKKDPIGPFSVYVKFYGCAPGEFYPWSFLEGKIIEDPRHDGTGLTAGLTEAKAKAKELLADRDIRLVLVRPASAEARKA